MNNKQKLKYLRLLIESEVKKSIEPEAPKNAPFGQYLFAPDRRDLSGEAGKEKNTDIEDEFFIDLINHIGGDPDSLDTLEKKLLNIKNKGWYSKFLSPPKNKNIYRILYNISTEEASKIVGSSVKNLTGTAYDVKNNNHIIKPGYSKQNMDLEFEYRLLNLSTHGTGTVYPKYNNTQSWSLKLLSDWVLMDLVPGNLYPGESAVLLVANTSKNNNLLLNPKNIDKIGALPKYAYYQEEIISFGPVKFDKAYVITNRVVDVGLGYDKERSFSVSSSVYVRELLRAAKSK